MELRDVKNLDQLNSLLNETVERGVTNAAQAKWGGRDFILTDADGAQTTVKMKDLVNKFRELANEKGADKNKINEITKNIIKLDFAGDVKLEKFGEMSKRIRNLKNLITPSHLDVIDAISENHLFKSKDVRERALVITKKNNDLKKEFILNNFDEKTKSALRYLLNKDYNSAHPIIGALRNNERVEVRDFIESLDQEMRVKIIRDFAIESETGRLKRTDARVDLLIENFKKNPENFAEKYFTSDLREGGGFHIDYKQDLVALVHRDPAKAYPIIRALATYSVPEGFDMKEVKVFSGDRKDVKNLCQGLIKQCEKHTFERLKRAGDNPEISLNVKGEWQISYANDARTGQKLGEVLDVPDSQLTPLLFKQAVTFSFNNINKSKRKLLGLTPFEAAKTASTPISEIQENARTPERVKEVGDFKAKIIEAKKIIEKAIEDKTITDDELRALFKENKIDMKSDYFFTDKNDPKDKPNLARAMERFRPDMLKEMQPNLEPRKINESFSHREADQLHADLHEAVRALSRSAASRLKRSSSSAYNDIINLNKALNEYGSNGKLTAIRTRNDGTQASVQEIFQDAFAENSSIRKEIIRLQSKDSQEEEKKLGTVLTRILDSLQG